MDGGFAIPGALDGDWASDVDLAEDEDMALGGGCPMLGLVNGRGTGRRTAIPMLAVRRMLMAEEALMHPK